MKKIYRKVLAFAVAALLTLSPPPAAAQDTPGTVKFPAALDTADSLIRASNSARTTLSGSLTSGSTTINVVSTASFPASGAAMIDNEIIFYSGKTSTQLTGVTRGADSTTAASHSSGAAVRGVITAAHHNTLSSAIQQAEGKLGAGASAPSAGTFLRGIGAGQSAWGGLQTSEVQSALGDFVQTFNGRGGAVSLQSSDLNGLSGAGLTGIGVGTSTGHSATGSVTVMGDSDADGTGVVAVGTGGVNSIVVNSDHTVDVLTGLNAPDRGGQLINIKAYGAKCDWNGSTGTDDTAAINSAISAALSSYKRLYIPGSTGGCLVTAASSQIFLLNSVNIEIFGDGYGKSRLIVKSTTPNTVDVFKFSPPATGGQPTGAWAHQENGRDNRGLYLHDFAIIAQSEPSMYTQPYPSQPARHALYFDTRTTGQFIEGVTIERCWFGSFSGKAMYFDNAAGATYANLDGQYQMVISNNIIRNGIVGDWWGDSLRVTNNRFIGEGAAVDSKQVGGATTLNFRDNNCTSRGGCGTFHNGYTINYTGNIVELGFVGSTGVNGALVDFRGDLDEIKSLHVEENIFNSIGAGGNLDGVRLDNVVGAYIGANNYNSALSGTHYRVVTTASSLSTYISPMNVNMSGIALLTNSADPFPVTPLVTLNGEPTVATLTPHYLGVERAYARSIVATGGASPLLPTSAAGAHLYYDADAHLSGGALSTSGGSGAALLTGSDFGAGARRDLYLGGERGLLDFTSGVSIGSGGTPTKKRTHGTCTLTAGACTVSTSAVTAGSRVMLSGQDNNVTGALRVSARSAGVSFTVTSSNAGDSGLVAYEIVEP